MKKLKYVKKAVIFGGILIAVIGGIAGAKGVFSSKAAKETAATASTKTSVKVLKAKSIEKASGDIYKANLEPYEQGIVTNKIGGKVVKVSFENGQYVSQGDTLIVIDDQDIRNQLKTAQSQLEVSENQLKSSQISLQKFQTAVENAQRDYDRNKTLLEHDTISKVTFEGSETALKNAKTDYDSENANIETLKASVESSKVSIANLQDSLKDTIIKAPLSGVIDGKSVNVGEYANPGTQFAKVNDISYIYAVIQVDQEKVNSIALGQAAVVNVNNDDKNSSSFDGVVKSINLCADPSARVFNCKIQVDNKNKSLLPGVFAKAQIVTGNKTEMFSIPIGALAGSEGQYYIFINDNGIAKRREVSIGEINGDMVEIKSGIKNEDEIICTNISTLQDGDKIRVVSK